jgi:hypothetical protein
MTRMRIALRCAMLLAGIALAPCSRAHDSWFDESGRIVTGTRYPSVDLVVPPESIAARTCDDEGTCWAELREFGVELDAATVDVYFREARPSEAVRTRWATLRAAGVGWHERYRKFMRTGTGTLPAGLDLELLPADKSVLAPGKPARFVLLSKGRPVVDQPVELRSDRSPLGIWSRTDGRGQVEWTIPFGARWLVRTIAIEPDGDTAWRSRFATLVLDVQP